MKPALQALGLDRSAASLTAFSRVEKSFDWNWHYHPEFELTWIRRGHGRRLVGDFAEKYAPGDLVLLGANLPHTWASAPGVKRNEAVVVQFQTFPSDLLRLPEFALVADLLGRAGAGLHFPMRKRIGREMERLLEKRGLSAWLQLASVLDRLAQGAAPRMLATFGYRYRRSLRVTSRIEKVVAFIEANFRDAITLSDAATVAGCTPSALSRLFRRTTNLTFVSYRNACRVREACRLLVETDLPVTRVAGDSGFDNLANFNRRFRQRQNMTPLEYRGVHNAPTSTVAGRRTASAEGNEE